MRHPLPARQRPLLTLLASAATLALAACGAGSSTTSAGAGTVTTSSSSLSGTVAVGAPIANGKLRVIDATGAVVASDVTVDANGQYADVTLTGTGPYRIEACGYAGANYQCVYSAATAAGTANVTPLTTATLLLATGQAPATLMEGTAGALTANSLEGAQSQLRTSLSSVLTSAGITAPLDFISGSLSAGSRSGYDGVLDAIGVSTGEDDHAFVQITPRLGTGNLYMTQGTTSGNVTAAAGASSLQLGGLEDLFHHLSDAFASPSACTDANTGVARYLASNAQMSLGDGAPVQGATQVAQGLCQFFGQGEDGSTAMWGSHLLSPVLGRCDLSGAEPLCKVSFVLQNAQGDVQPVGEEMGVTREGGEWRFFGDLNPIQVHASAKAQRTVRLDSATPVVEYDRALAFEVQVMPGLQCARVSQRDADGNEVDIAYYKRHPGAVNQARLSLWTADGFGQGVSLDPTTGSTRSEDDTWVALPQGAAGDAVVRNFYRGGRSVSVSLYSDAACTTAFLVGSRSQFDVDVQGVPPVSAALATLPWPELDAATRSALRGLAMDHGTSREFPAAWTFPAGPLGLGDSTFCSSRETCGDNGLGRLASRRLRPSATSTTLTLSNGGPTVNGDDDKTFSLGGRTADGVDLQANFSSCPSQGSGQACH